MYPSPMASQEIKGFDYNEPNSNANYQQEINQLYNKILASLKPLDKNNSGKVNENDLLMHLKSLVPAGKVFDQTLFKNLFHDLDRTDNLIDISEFTKKYIQVHEELKFTLEGEKNEHAKDKTILNELQTKIYSSQNEPLSNNGMSKNAQLKIEIGKVELHYSNIATDLFFKLTFNKNEKKTSIRGVGDLNFIEKFEFPIDSKQYELRISLFTKDNNSNPIGEIEIPLSGLLDNEETIPMVPLNDIDGNQIGKFYPKIALITSFFDFYKNKYKEIDEKIKAGETNIQKMSEAYEKISAPYQYLFDETTSHGLFGGNGMENKIIDKVEASMKNIFRLNDVKWIKVLQIILYFCVGMTFITNLSKNDFLSLFVELCFIIVINTEKTQYIFEYFYTFLSMLVVIIVYDLTDYLILRATSFASMKSCNSWVALFSFLGFIGKLLLLLFIWICKVKYGKRGIVY